MFNSIEEMKKEMLKRPDSFMYCGDLDLKVWGFANGFGTHRDASILTQSNHEYVLKELRKISPQSVQVMECSHWLVGYCSHIMIKTSAKKTMERLYEIYERSESYAVLDEDDFCRRECEQAAEAYDAWARWDVSKMAETHEITALLDHEGDFDPTPEQEDLLRRIVSDCIMDFGGDNEYRDEDVIESMREFFPTPTEVEVAEAAGQGRLIEV
jgi:hypothetical protein